MSVPIIIAWAPNGRDLMPWPVGGGYVVDREVHEENVIKRWRGRSKKETARAGPEVRP